MSTQSQVHRKKQEYEDQIERVKFLLGTYKIDRNLQVVFQVLQKRISLIYARSFNRIHSASKRTLPLSCMHFLGALERVYQRQLYNKYLHSFLKIRLTHTSNKITTLKKEISPKRGQNRKFPSTKTVSQGNNKRRILKYDKKTIVKREQLEQRILIVREKIQMITKAYRQFLSKLQGNKTNKVPPNMMQTMYKY